MNNLILITRRNCEACTIMLHNLADALDEVVNEVTLRVRHVESISTDTLSELNIKAYPTLLIKKEGKEIARLEGTFPKDYLIDVISKFNDDRKQEV